MGQQSSSSQQSRQGQQSSSEEQKKEEQNPFFKKIEKVQYDEEKPYFLILIGPSRSGKSSFLKMICLQQEVASKIKIGDGMNSCTNSFELYHIENEILFGKRGAMVLDTVGFGDTSDELDDVTILSLLHCKLMNAAAKIQMKIDAIFIFQDAKCLIKVKSLINDMILLFGQEVQKNLLICLTKINSINDDDQYTLEEFKNEIAIILKQINFDIPVVDLFTSYIHRRKGEIKPDQSGIDIQNAQIRNFFLNSRNALDLVEIWNSVQKQAQEIYETMKKSEINKKYGELVDKFTNQDKNDKKFSFLKMIYLFTNKKWSQLRQEAIELVEKFYENNPALAYQATEMILCKEIRMKKYYATSQQIRKHISKTENN